MPGGYTGKILRVNLTNKSISQIPTEKYEEFGGGHGIGSAIFFDLVGDQLPFEAFDPRNLIIMMASPFSGTFMPGSGRCEVQGLAPMLYPIEWFGHSNFGGRFTAQLKYAGWDGIVVEGAASEPVWINIVNDKVTIESANGIWGMDTWDTQEEISRRVMPQLKPGEWAELSDSYTTQVPAVVCCGPAGERKSRLGPTHGCSGRIMRFRRRFRVEEPQGDKRDRHRERSDCGSEGIHGCPLWFRQFSGTSQPQRAGKRGSWYSRSACPSGGNA